MFHVIFRSLFDHAEIEIVLDRRDPTPGGRAGRYGARPARISRCSR